MYGIICPQGPCPLYQILVYFLFNHQTFGYRVFHEQLSRRENWGLGTAKGVKEDCRKELSCPHPPPSCTGTQKRKGNWVTPEPSILTCMARTLSSMGTRLCLVHPMSSTWWVLIKMFIKFFFFLRLRNKTRKQKRQFSYH